LHGLKDATTDAATIRKWFTWWPDANIGLRTGAPGIVALDLDSPAAAEALLELANGRRLGGRMIATGRGRQLWYLAPAADDIPSGTKLRRVDGLDVRGRDAYVAAPPSLHYTGVEYRVLSGELEPLPDFLYVELRARARDAPAAAARPPCVGDGTRFGLAVLRRECEELRTTAEGGRNRKLNLVSYLAGRLVAGGEVSAEYAAAEIELAASEVGLDPQEIAGRDGESGTLWSGLRAGQRSPLTALTAPVGMPETVLHLLDAETEEELWSA
jgi:hypothetical protein